MAHLIPIALYKCKHPFIQFIITSVIDDDTVDNCATLCATLLLNTEEKSAFYNLEYAELQESQRMNALRKRLSF